ncbi:MAG: hypothetical protein AVO39_02720 [delta proteobacterium MLS_D]|nr:MAG: hypothetical protein AVO39_02720 [delta proteobacterium MLS_D]
MKHARFCCICLVAVLVAVFCFYGPSVAGGWFGEMAVGCGSSINPSPATKQVLVIPALCMLPAAAKNLQLRLEGDLEVIHHDGKETVVAGIGAMARLFVFAGGRLGPYIEGGVGANYVSRQAIDHRDLGGSFIFSPMAGAGYGFSLGGRNCSLGVRCRHISNAGIYKENDGMDSLYLLGSIAF